MYSVVLLVHSWWRWVVLLLVLAAALRAVGGRLTGRPWTPMDRRGHLLATVSLDVQLILGLLLYLFLSPFTAEAFRNFSAAMRTASLRYWAVEHIATMVVALLVAHVGNVLARKGKTDASRHLRGAIVFGLVALLLLMATPWPGMPNARPLFRFGG